MNEWNKNYHLILLSNVVFIDWQRPLHRLIRFSSTHRWNIFPTVFFLSFCFHFHDKFIRTYPFNIMYRIITKCRNIEATTHTAYNWDQKKRKKRNKTVFSIQWQFSLVNWKIGFVLFLSRITRFSIATRSFRLLNTIPIACMKWNYVEFSHLCSSSRMKAENKIIVKEPKKKKKKMNEKQVEITLNVRT